MTKKIFMISGAILILIAAIATPFCMVYGIYEWAVMDVEFKTALWEVVKTWMLMVFMVVSGAFLYYLGRNYRI